MSNSQHTRVRASDELKREFSKRLLEKLASRDMNQSDLARAAKISKDAVSTYARARSVPTDDTLVRIAKVLNCQPADLLPKRFDSVALASPLQMTMLDDGRVSLSINTSVDFDTAMQIMDILRSETLHTT